MPIIDLNKYLKVAILLLNMACYVEPKHVKENEDMVKIMFHNYLHSIIIEEFI
jgi:hypothetical protein